MPDIDPATSKPMPTAKQLDEVYHKACRSCGAALRWAVTGNGKLVPLDAQPEKRIVLIEPKGPEGVRLAQVVDTYTSHFATCPQADKWRKKEKKDEHNSG